MNTIVVKRLEIEQSLHLSFLNINNCNLTLIKFAINPIHNDINVIQETQKELGSENVVLLDVKKNEKVTFDDILVDLGDFGRYQKMTYFLLFIPTIFSAMQKQAWVFLGAKAPHRCKVEGP